MFASSQKKKPLIKLDRNQLKKQKPQSPIGPKISLKMHEKFMEKVNKLKKKGYNGLSGTIGQKS